MKLPRHTRIPIIVAVLAPFLLAAGAGTALPLPARSRTPQASRHFTDLSAFVQELDKSYPFFDVKGLRKGWPAKKKQLLAKAMRCSSDQELIGLALETIRYLRDGHMGLVKVSAKMPEAKPEYCPGISFLPATKKRVVVMSTVESLSRVLSPGTVVTRIDRKPARAFLEFAAQRAWKEGGYFSSPQRARLLAYRIALRGKKGERHEITYLSGRRKKTLRVTSSFEARGWPHTYNMPEGLTRNGRSCWYGVLPSGVGYIWLRRIDASVEPGIAAALGAHPDAKGWIVDLRGNGGGGYGSGLLKKVAGLPRPVAGIIDAGCFSAGETFARDLVRYAGARLFGARTAGSSSAKRTWTFPSGIATVIIPTRSRGGLKRGIEFFGIDPDEPVEAVPEEVAAGKNSATLRAEKYLLGKVAGKKPR